MGDAGNYQVSAGSTSNATAANAAAPRSFLVVIAARSPPPVFIKTSNHR
jgi:hypothetical protein